MLPQNLSRLFNFRNSEGIRGLGMAGAQSGDELLTPGNLVACLHLMAIFVYLRVFAGIPLFPLLKDQSIKCVKK